MKERTFPHIPKSSKSLQLGDFWSIPLDDNQFACGRVIGFWHLGNRGSLRGFFAGLLDWVSDSPPTATAIGGAKILIQGSAHIKTILVTGGSILGNRPLQLDDICPNLFIEYPENKQAYVFRGLENIRIATPDDKRMLPPLATFGFKFMHAYANANLRKKV